MTTAVYVSNADSGDLWVCHLDAQRGELTPVQRMMIGGQVMPLALDPSRRFLYAARRSGRARSRPSASMPRAANSR